MLIFYSEFLGYLHTSTKGQRRDEAEEGEKRLDALEFYTESQF